MNVLDAIRRFGYFGSQRQQPSLEKLVSASDNEDRYHGIQQKSIAIVQQWLSSQDTILEDERQQPEWEDVQGAQQSLSRTNIKTLTQKGIRWFEGSWSTSTKLQRCHTGTNADALLSGYSKFRIVLRFLDRLWK